jgi:hypothetical protein
MKLFRLSAIPVLALVGLAFGVLHTANAATTPSPNVSRSLTPGYLILAQSEVFVPQASGFLRHSVLPPVHRTRASGANGGLPTGQPITCNSSNATSPDCYTATQQGKPMPK